MVIIYVGTLKTSHKMFQENHKMENSFTYYSNKLFQMLYINTKIGSIMCLVPVSNRCRDQAQDFHNTKVE